MHELYMSFAAFVYYAKKSGFEFIKQGKTFLSFNYSGGNYYFCKIMPGKNKYDCGYIVINVHDFKLLFGDDDDYIKDIKSCERLNIKLPDGSMEHCHLPKPLWGNIRTEIKPEIFINCLRK